MNIFILNGSEMINKNSCHEHLSKILRLPEYYGNTLDSLYDCVSTMFIAKETEITLCGFNSLPDDLRKYGQKITQIFIRVAYELAHVKDGSMMILNILN